MRHVARVDATRLPRNSSWEELTKLYSSTLINTTLTLTLMLTHQTGFTQTGYLRVSRLVISGLADYQSGYNK